MLVRATLILIALFVGGWMVFEGTHVLIYGRFFGPEKPGPWSAVVSSLGLNPFRFGVPLTAHTIGVRPAILAILNKEQGLYFGRKRIAKFRA
jgi:hypothetical protein